MSLPTQYTFWDTSRGDVLFNAAAIAAILGGSPVALVGTTITATGDVAVTKSATVTAPSTDRLIYGKLSATYAGAVTTSGNLCGVRGEFALGNAATVLGVGYYYGTQGKVTAVTGATIGAGAHAFGLVGQFDMSLGHVTGDPQISPIWGDMGATGPSNGWGVNSSLISSQNTTAFPTQSHIYTYGAAAYYATISSNGGAFLSTGAATPSGAMKKLKVSIDGVDYYILAAATWS